jgi:hypothetical protein
VTGSVRSKRFALFRVVFGAYLFVLFSLLVPLAEEIFGREGALPDLSWTATAGLLPNPLHFVDTGLGLQVAAPRLALGLDAARCLSRALDTARLHPPSGGCRRDITNGPATHGELLGHARAPPPP